METSIGLGSSGALSRHMASASANRAQVVRGQDTRVGECFRNHRACARQEEKLPTRAHYVVRELMQIHLTVD